jgi:sodium transport system permease protein
VTVFNQSGEAPWHLAVPALGQVALMNRVLKGEGVGPLDMGLAFAVCAVITAAGLVYIARQLRTAATR